MTLLFVYNANSGTLNGLFDIGHKLFSPSTYQCSLCAITHDIFKENTAWKNFKNQSQFQMEFYHKDEFETKFPNVSLNYPTVLRRDSYQLTTVLTPEVLNKISSVEALIKGLKANVQ